MASGKDEWWVTRQGERFGPVTFEQMVEAARSGRLEPRTDLVYGGKLSEWTPACEVEGLFERRQPTEEESAEAKAAGGHAPPDDSLADSGSYDFGHEPTHLDLPGAGRLGYFLGLLFLPTVLALGLAVLLPRLQEFVGETVAPWLPLLMLLVPIVAIVIIVKRFQNLAMSGWWWLGCFVPILNLWLNYRLFACPPGYGYTKKLDGIGKFLAVVYWLLVAASFVLPVIFGAAALHELQQSGKWEEFLNEIRNAMPERPPGEDDAP